MNARSSEGETKNDLMHISFYNSYTETTTVYDKGDA